MYKFSIKRHKIRYMSFETWKFKLIYLKVEIPMCFMCMWEIMSIISFQLILFEYRLIHSW